MVETSKVRQEWAIEKFVDQEIERIRALVGEKGQAIGALSGGVDSTATAKPMREAIGNRFHAILVNNGVLRMDEAKVVKETFNEHLGIPLRVCDATDLFLSPLKGVSDPEKKRKIITNTFIEVFRIKQRRLLQSRQACLKLETSSGYPRGRFIRT